VEDTLDGYSGHVRQTLLSADVVVCDITRPSALAIFQAGVREAFETPLVLVSQVPLQSDSISNLWARDTVIEITTPTGPQRLLTVIATRLNSGRMLTFSELRRVIAGQRLETTGVYPYMDRFGEWRASSLREDLQNLWKGSWAFAYEEPNWQTAQIFEKFLTRVAKPGDSWLAVTRGQFWSSVNLGRTQFLAANVAAAREGVRICRVFVVEREWIERDGSCPLLAELKRIHDDAAREANAAAEAARSGGSLTVRYLYPQKSQPGLARWEEFPHCGIVCRLEPGNGIRPLAGTAGAAAVPTYKEELVVQADGRAVKEERIIRVDCKFGSAPIATCPAVGQYFNGFKKAWDLAPPGVTEAT
jgi:hypothetical protein